MHAGPAPLDGASPLVEVVIPHRSRWPLLQRCLDSLAEQTLKPAVCVVDNASTDDTIERLRHEAVRVCALDTNHGFGRAVNIGIRSSTARYVVTLNNDMVAERRCVEHLVAALEAGGRMAVAGALQLRPDGLVDSAGIAIDRGLAAYDVGTGAPADDLDPDGLRAFGPSGGSTAMHRELFLAVGGYDPAFFAYLEDVDLALRLHHAGATYALAPGARVTHEHSSTLGSGSRQKNRLMGWSRGYLLRKYRSHMAPRQRVRALCTDAVIYGGQLFMHRNGGSIEGRARFALSGPRPTLPDAADPLPVSRLSFSAGLRRRRGTRT